MIENRALFIRFSALLKECSFGAGQKTAPNDFFMECWALLIEYRALLIEYTALLKFFFPEKQKNGTGNF